MRRKADEQIISRIRNGEEDVLFYLSKKYFESARRILRRNGCPDRDTPRLFSSILVNLSREIQRNRISPNIGFESFLFNSIWKHVDALKKEKEKNAPAFPSETAAISSCFTILDDNARRLLAARYCEGLSYEEIAVRMEYSNPVIAQFECDKAFSQYEKIVRARLNLS